MTDVISAFSFKIRDLQYALRRRERAVGGDAHWSDDPRGDALVIPPSASAQCAPVHAESAEAVAAAPVQAAAAAGGRNTGASTYAAAAARQARDAVDLRGSRRTKMVMKGSPIISTDDLILVTGSNGFIGTALVEVLLEHGFRNIRCLVRSKRNRIEGLFRVIDRFPHARVHIVEGNLQSRADAAKVTGDVRVVFHLAAGMMETTFAGLCLTTVVTTRNLLEGVCQAGVLRRFVNVSSLAVYSNRHLRRHALLDETCALETKLVERDEPYVYAKLKQEELVQEYAAKYGLPYVVLRPGAVYGPGQKADITHRVGERRFGIFLHLGGRNRIPFTHVRNCAEAIALAGTTPGVDGEVFNVIDDEPPTSRQFMAGYRRHVGRRKYLSVPYPLFYALCLLWEKYSRWSEGALPPVFNRYKCAAYWKGNRYSNRKLKALLNWRPAVSYQEGVRAYYDYLRNAQSP